MIAGDKIGGAHDATFHHIELGTGAHQPDSHAGAQGALHHTKIDDDAPVAIVDAIEDEGLQGGFRIALGGGDIGDDALQHLVDIDTVFGGDAGGIHGGDADDILDLVADPLGIGGRQVNLIDDGEDLQTVIYCQIAVGKGLRFDALGGIDNENSALTGGQRPADLIVEIDMAGGINEIEVIGFAVIGFIIQRDGAGLDGDTALPLQLHIIQDLIFHITLGNRFGGFQDAVGEGALAVIDMGDDAEIADVVLIAHGVPPVDRYNLTIYYSTKAREKQEWGVAQ